MIFRSRSVKFSSAIAPLRMVRRLVRTADRFFPILRQISGVDTFSIQRSFASSVKSNLTPFHRTKTNLRASGGSNTRSSAPPLRKGRPCVASLPPVASWIAEPRRWAAGPRACACSARSFTDLAATEWRCRMDRRFAFRACPTAGDLQARGSVPPLDLRHALARAGERGIMRVIPRSIDGKAS